MKKTLFTLFTAINLALLYCPAAFALTEDEAAAAVDAQGKDAVSGNLFLWLLCAIAFLKVATKLSAPSWTVFCTHWASAFHARPARCCLRRYWLFAVLKSAKPLWGWVLQKPPPQLLPQKPHPATPLQAGSPAW